MAGPATEARVKEVVDACARYGGSSIIALAGAPATGKSHIAIIAAQRHAGEPTRVKEIQFHQSFTYEEFIEGLRIDSTGAVQPTPGVFLDWNEDASADPVADHRYVLLIEELTRANLSTVLGELLTYVEHRDRDFETLFSRTKARIAKNLTILATFNPVDRSALSIDDALLRRLRIIDFLPDDDQLAEMLGQEGRKVPLHVIEKLKLVFDRCRQQHGPDYETLMPFGHGIFSEVYSEADLYALWHQRIKRILRRPLLDPHPFTDTIEEAFPWRDAPQFRLPVPSTAEGEATTAEQASSTPTTSSQ
ncbi:MULTISPECIES: AAA family ATPase [unclassified Bradyrhizobium]|uniref:AAA family ATPase n=1 Tax=unclassified Bradyrhizobium TaxID=2631580 RepID=UPI0028EA5D80|nr:MULTISPECIES: AAA family ATPase [unclassified Bradyrhizobium]